MKSNKNWYSTLICVFVLSFFVGKVHAQPADTLRKQVEFLIYKNPDSAIALLKKLEKQPEDQSHLAHDYLRFANAYLAKRDYRTSLDYADKALTISEKHDEPLQHARVLNSVAAQYHLMGIFNKSLQLLDRAAAILRKLPAGDGIDFQHGRNYAIRGMVYKSQGNPQIALEQLLAALDYFRSSKVEQNKRANQSIVCYNIGYCYLLMNDISSAFSYFKEAYAMATTMDAPSLKAYALKGMADAETAAGDNKNAITHLRQAEELVVGTDDLTLEKGIFRGLADNHLALSDLGKFSYYDAKATKSETDSEAQERSSIALALIRAQNRTADEIKSIRTETGRVSIVIVLVSILTTGLFVLLLRKEQKQNNLLKEELKRLNQENETL